VAAKELEHEVHTTVYNLHTIKPLDKEAILAAAKEAGAVVTVEEHQRAGGMGSAVAELLAAECPVPVEFIGVNDSFGQSGKPDELIEHYRLGVSHIKEAIRKSAGRKL
jgi:transketolase